MIEATLTNPLPKASIAGAGIANYSDATVAQNPEWLQILRTSGLTRFQALGFPTRRDEDWRYTPVAPIVETPFAQGQPGMLHPTLLNGREVEDSVQLVFVNGHFEPGASRIENLPAGVRVTNLAQAIASGEPLVERYLGKYVSYDNHAFAALNTASITEGVFIHLSKSAVLEQPIHVVYASQPGESGPTVSHPRLLLVADENSQCTIIERYVGRDGDVYLLNGVSEFIVAENAVVDHYKVQQESKAAFHVANLQVEIAHGANFSSHSLGFGGLIARSDAGARLGEGCTATLNGLFMAGGRQIMDSHTTLDHAMPNCPSHQIYKHILDDHSRGVFNGRIFVQLDAQKTDAKQTNQTLLLSKDAEINTKPQLEIFADDVRCTHGATVGQLRGDQLFYLRARGIGKQEAQDLLIYAFASDIVQRIKVDSLRDELDKVLLSERRIESIR